MQWHHMQCMTEAFLDSSLRFELMLCDRRRVVPWYCMVAVLGLTMLLAGHSSIHRSCQLQLSQVSKHANLICSKASSLASRQAAHRSALTNQIARNHMVEILIMIIIYHWPTKSSCTHVAINRRIVPLRHYTKGDIHVRLDHHIVRASAHSYRHGPWHSGCTRLISCLLYYDSLTAIYNCYSYGRTFRPCSINYPRYNDRHNEPMSVHNQTTPLDPPLPHTHTHSTHTHTHTHRHTAHTHSYTYIGTCSHENFQEGYRQGQHFHFVLSHSNVPNISRVGNLFKDQPRIPEGNHGNSPSFSPAPTPNPPLPSPPFTLHALLTRQSITHLSGKDGKREARRFPV